MSTRLSYRIATAVALVVSGLALTPLGASARPALAGTSSSLRSPAWMRHVPVRSTTTPVGGALTRAELPGAANPSEPYAAVSQALTGRPVGQPNAAGLGAHVQRMTVNPVSGDLSFSVDDLFIPERSVPLSLSLTYNSYFASTNGPFGRGWSFNAGLRLTKAADGSVTISQENGSQVTFQHTAAGYAAAPRVIASLRETPDVFVFTRGTLGLKCPKYSRSCVKFIFSKAFTPTRLTKVSTPDGGLTLGYTAGKLTAVKDPAGRKLTFKYKGDQASVAALDGNPQAAVQTSYDSNGNLKRFTNAAGASYGFLYDAFHRMTGVIDPRGVETAIVYDSAGGVQSVTDGGGQTQYSHSPAGGTVTRPGGAISTLYLAGGEVTRIDEGVDPAVPLATTLFTYNPATLGPTAVTNPDGHTSHMAYDALGHLTSYTDPLGHTSTYHFGAATGIIDATDPLGTVSRATTDTTGRIVSIALDTGHPALTETTRFHYGNAVHPGDITSVTDAEGHVWLFAYDKYGNPTQFTDPLGNTSSTSYDRMGRPAINTALNNPFDGTAPPPPTTFTYDPEGRLLSTTDPLGNPETFSYDAVGNLIATVAGGNQTNYGYDAAGRWTVISRPNGSRATISYDAGIVDPGEVCDDGGECEKHTYDDLGHPATFTDALGNTSSFVYSPGGLLLSSTDANGVTTSYTYDANGQTTGVSYSDGITHPVAFDFDADGRMVSMTDGTGTSTFTYDSLGRKTKEVSGLGMESDLVYDRLDHVTSMTLNSVLVASYTYDAAGRQRAFEDRLGNRTRFSYDASSHLTQTLFPGGDVDRDGYDAAGRLVHFSLSDSTSDPASIDIAYTRNLLGQITGAAQTGAGQPDQTYGYDANGRLFKARHVMNVVPQNFDERNNLLQNAAGNTFTYDAANRLVSEDEKDITPDVNWQFGYDDNGSRTSATTLDGSQSKGFVWDAAGNLASFTGGSTAESNSYDGLGRRVSSTAAGFSHTFVWDSARDLGRIWGNGPADPRDDDCNGSGIACAVAATGGKAGFFLDEIKVLAQRTAPASGPLSIDGTVYLYGPEGLPVEQIDSSDQALFYHHDQLGSTRALSTLTPGEHVIDVYGYDVWGNLTYHSGTDTVPFGFGGAYTDPFSHLVLAGQDWYDPPTGQFISRIRRAITVGQNAPVLLRSGNPAVLSVELFFDMYEEGIKLDAGLGYDSFSDFPSAPWLTMSGGSATQDAYSNFVAVPDRVRARSCRYWDCQRPGWVDLAIGLSPYALGGGDPINKVDPNCGCIHTPVTRSNIGNN